MSLENERRNSSGGTRLPIKTIVEIGAGEGGSASFEAESVNVNVGGMQLKTAYLPEVGEPLACRFETGGGRQVTVQGNVVWRKQEAYGGEFGVRFSEVDPESMQALREIAAESNQTGESFDSAASAGSIAGARVKLHIEGVPSPMKARVLDASSGCVTVGSKLDFLRVGRALELENVDCDERREVRIDKVAIELDQSSVPQLVVSLRYEGEKVRAAAPRAQTTQVIPEADPFMPEPEDELMQFEKPNVVWSHVKQVGPVLASMGGKAKDVMTSTFGKMLHGRGEMLEASPLRVTAPAPGGALRADGRRLVRDDDVDFSEMDFKPHRKLPKRLAIGAGIGVMALLVAIAASGGKKKEPLAIATDSVAAAASSSAPAEANPPLASPGAIVANVPLFGATPMATTEPAPMAPGSAPVAIAALGQAAAAGQQAAAPEQDEVEGQADKSDAHSHKASDKGADKITASGPKSFAHGKITNPTTMSLRMASKIKGIHGVSTATGFTVHIDGAQSKDAAASALAHRDPRIASVKASNRGSGSDLTFQFKDGVPPYAVRAMGSAITIALGHTDSGKKTASKTDKAAPHKAAKHHDHAKDKAQ